MIFKIIFLSWFVQNLRQFLLDWCPPLKAVFLVHKNTFSGQNISQLKLSSKDFSSCQIKSNQRAGSTYFYGGQRWYCLTLKLFPFIINRRSKHDGVLPFPAYHGIFSTNRWTNIYLIPTATRDVKEGAWRGGKELKYRDCTCSLGIVESGILNLKSTILNQKAHWELEPVLYVHTIQQMKDCIH